VQHGKTLIDAKGGIVEMALERDKTMSIFYARSRGDWRQASDDQMSGDASAVFTINISHGSPSTPDTISHSSPSTPDTGH
jgi:hypothetical protein